MNKVLKAVGTPVDRLSKVVPKDWKTAIIVIVALVVSSWTACCIAYHSALRIVDYSPIFHTAQSRSSTDKVTFHHTAIDSDSTSILGIYDYHHNNNGWSCIAYHYLIIKGVIYKLHDDNDRTPHAYGANDNAISVCYNADFNKRAPNFAEYWQIASLITKLMRKYNLTSDNVFGHGEMSGNSTECPGVKCDMQFVRLIVKFQRILL